MTNQGHPGGRIGVSNGSAGDVAMRVRMFGVLASAAVGLMLMASAREMRADTVVFSNFTEPGNTYEGASWWTVGTTIKPPTGTQADAFPFSPTQTATLTGADLALAANGPVSPLNLYIEANGASGPGMILDTLTQVGSYTDYPTTSLVNFTCSGTCTTLNAGSTYWIVATQSNPANTTFWLNSFTDSAPWYYNLTNSATGPWTLATAAGNDSAFDVTGTPSTVPPIPEPASAALLASGLLGIAGAVRRRAWRR